MSEPALNLDQLRAFFRFSQTHKVEPGAISYAEEWYKGCVEIKLYASEKGWEPIGQETYCWISKEGEILGTAARAMADGGPAPRAGEGRRATVVIGHYRQLGDSMAEVVGKSFFTVSENIGVVPTVRHHVAKYIEKEK